MSHLGVPIEKEQGVKVRDARWAHCPAMPLHSLRVCAAIQVMYDEFFEEEDETKKEVVVRVMIAKSSSCGCSCLLQPIAL